MDVPCFGGISTYYYMLDISYIIIYNIIGVSYIKLIKNDNG